MATRESRATGRTYYAPRRAERARRTRERILAAATARFLERGYAATTMREVAAGAGVSLPTVELAFGTKSNLLKSAIDVAIAGDDETVPMLERAWTRAARSAPDARAFLEIVAEVVHRSQLRASGLLVAAYEVAARDLDIAAFVTRQEAQREGTVRWIVEGLMRYGPLRPDRAPDEAVDTLWLLMDPVLFHRLTTARGWTAERVRDWFVDAALRLLLARPGEPRHLSEEES